MTDANQQAPGKYIFLCARTTPYDRTAEGDVNKARSIKAIRISANPSSSTAVSKCMEPSTGDMAMWPTSGDAGNFQDLNMGNSGNWIFACVGGGIRCPTSYPNAYAGSFCCNQTPSDATHCPGQYCALDPNNLQGAKICP